MLGSGKKNTILIKVDMVRCSGPIELVNICVEDSLITKNWLALNQPNLFWVRFNPEIGISCTGHGIDRQIAKKLLIKHDCCRVQFYF